MRPSEVRERVLADHASLRVALAELKTLAGSVKGGASSDALRLREAGEQLLDALARHMEWEDVHLARALRDADAWGEERERRLVEEHREQRQALSDVLQHLRDTSRSASQIADDALDFVDWLRRDMEGEEDERLQAELLRDDVVGIDVEAG